MSDDTDSLKTTRVTTEASASSTAAVGTIQSLLNPADAPMTLLACFQEILRYLPSAAGNDNDTYVSRPKTRTAMLRLRFLVLRTHAKLS